jgi:hypothetical protein
VLQLVNSLGGNTSAGGLLSRATGQVLNPNLELLFSGVNLRSFAFDFDFAPRDEKESNVVKEIIRVFKQSMAPRTGSNTEGAGLFIEAPNIFLLKYKSGNQDHPYLNKFKPCALTSMGMNYTGSGSYSTYAKNIFRRVKLRDDLQNVFTIFNKYQIQEGARPDTVAEELYGSSQYDWVVLIGAGIINVRNEWPLSDRDIYRYSEELYGNDLNAVHHYETTEVKDSNGRLILPAGKIVDSTFTIPDPNISIQTLNPVVGISNYEYEVRKNNKKRDIYVLKPAYLQQVINDTRKAMTYDRSSQYVNDKLIRTENTRVTMP